MPRKKRIACSRKTRCAGTRPGGLHWSHGDATERSGDRESIPDTIQRAGAPLDRLHWLHGEATERSGDRESIRRCLRGYPDYWSVRVSQDIRVVGKRRGDTIEWAWIGTHNNSISFSDSQLAFCPLSFIL